MLNYLKCCLNCYHLSKLLFNEFGYNADCYMEFISNIEEKLNNVGKYQVFVITRSRFSETSVAGILNLEGMTFLPMPQNYLVTRRDPDVITPTENLFKMGANGNLKLRKKLGDFLKLEEYDLIIFMLTFNMDINPAMVTHFLTNQNGKLTPEKIGTLKDHVVDMAITGMPIISVFAFVYKR